MMEKHLHIIAYSVPYPPNQGGLYDVFYNLKALHAAGVSIHLHCFDYGRGEQPTLHAYCASVQYYERFTGHKGIAISLPYIVASRKNEELLQNLLKDNYPILMEGIHCTYLLTDERFRNRSCFVRLHNVEYQYYHDLYKQAGSLFRKIYYKWESVMLKAYEKRIASKASFWAMTTGDTAVYRDKFGSDSVEHLPLYIPDDWTIEEKTGFGNYCLYHGDLSIDANEKAAIWLLENVFDKIDVPFVIAGHGPSKKLHTIAYHQGHTCLVADPSENEMQDMIAKAQINVLPSYIKTGIKIKLVNAIYNGRHCLVNSATVKHSGLESVCHIANSAKEFAEKIDQLFSQPFLSNESKKRNVLAGELFNNEKTTRKQISEIWKQIDS